MRGEAVPKIKVSIKHGDLRYARNPVLLGHYQADSIVGGERNLDECLCGKLSERRRLGLYPGPIETTDMVLDEDATPPGAIIVGLGAVGSLSTGELRRTIARGLVNYALLAAERDSAATFKPLKVTSMLVGSGEGGVTIQNSVAAILEAALDANRALLGTNICQRVRIDEVELLEIHLDRAVNASRVLRTWLQQGENARQVDIPTWQVANGKGGWRRIAYEQDKDWWTRLQITEAQTTVVCSSSPSRIVLGLKPTCCPCSVRASMHSYVTQFGPLTRIGNSHKPSSNCCCPIRSRTPRPKSGISY